MNATRKALTTLAVAAAMAGGVSIAQTSGTSTDTSNQNAGTSAQTSAPATSNDTSSSTMSNSTTTESSTLSNSSPAPQADRG